MESAANRVRPRVGGLLIQQKTILLVHIEIPTRPEPVWMPPGGEVEFTESVTTALQREFREETGLEIRTTRLLYVHEFIQEPYHAIEHYFLCSKVGGSLKTGKDPELKDDAQIIRKARFIPLADLKKYNIEPAFLKERLVADWQQQALGQTYWIGTTRE